MLNIILNSNHWYIHSTGSSGGEIKKSSTGLSPMRQSPGSGGGGGAGGLNFHARSTSYSVSHYVRRNQQLPSIAMDARGKERIFLGSFRP